MAATLIQFPPTLALLEQEAMISYLAYADFIEQFPGIEFAPIAEPMRKRWMDAECAYQVMLGEFNGAAAFPVA